MKKIYVECDNPKCINHVLEIEPDVVPDGMFYGFVAEARTGISIDYVTCSIECISEAAAHLIQIERRK